MSGHIDLESAVVDAAILSRITVEYIGRVLGMDGNGPLKLSEQDRTQLNFLVLEVCIRAEAAERAFFAGLETGPAV